MRRVRSTWANVGIWTLYVLLGQMHCGLARADPYLADGGGQPPSKTLYVARRGWHIDIGFAASDLTTELDSLAPRFPGLHYMFFGFGDRRYLTSKRRNAPNLLAALWPGRGVLLITALSRSPADAFGAAHVITLGVSTAQLQAVQRFILDSLENADSPAGLVPIAIPAPYPGSLYFAARASYSAIHTCNTWAAEALKKADMPVHSIGVVLAAQLWLQLRKLARSANAVAGPPHQQHSSSGLDS